MHTLPHLTGNRLEVLALGTGGDLLFSNSQLAVQINQGLLALVFLNADNNHIAGAIARDIDRLTSLAAKVGNLIGIIAQI